MSGSDDTRDSTPTGTGVGKDPCQQTRRGPINSPKAAVLAPLRVGDILQVDVDRSGPAPILIVKSLAGALAGSLTFMGYLELIQCIDAGQQYEAVILSITGAVYEVRVQPI